MSLDLELGKSFLFTLFLFGFQTHLFMILHCSVHCDVLLAFSPSNVKGLFHQMLGVLVTNRAQLSLRIASAGITHSTYVYFLEKAELNNCLTRGREPWPLISHLDNSARLFYVQLSLWAWKWGQHWNGIIAHKPWNA